MVKVANSLGAVIAERRLLFVVTDGDDTSPGVTSQDAVDACLKSGVTIIPVGLLSSGKERVGKINLLFLANGTGGRAVILNAPANLKPLISDILQSEYIVTYTPPSGNGLHRVKMEMTNTPKGVSLNAPEAYYAK